ncbi:hypothetical protein ACN47E_008316 [Coniothyrium glycines]
MKIFATRRKVEPRTPDEARVVYNNKIERLRKSEYPMLEGITYLDHGGTTVASKSMLTTFSTRMQATLLANPHSDASRPSESTKLVDRVRNDVLNMFSADPEHFDVIFTSNTTGAIKLVVECFSGHEGGFDYYYHRNAHTSLVGIRELARQSHCLASNEETEKWLSSPDPASNPTACQRPTLFAYPAQSNMNGERLPLDWPKKLRYAPHHSQTYTLLDAAALVVTRPLDLGNPAAAPDFVAFSFYKIFGFPDLGALLVRKESAHVLEKRKYFGGGTTDMITCLEEKPWVARKQNSIHARLEDGTIPIRSILALFCAMNSHKQIFGTMIDISKHTAWLSTCLYKGLRTLRHGNGVPVCHIFQTPGSDYGDPDTQGATIALNMRKSDGSWWSVHKVGNMLRDGNILVRAGSLCNPAGMACALDISATSLRRAYNDGFRCNSAEDIQNDGTVFGMIRLTLGPMSTMRDVNVLLAFIEKNIVERVFHSRVDSHTCIARTIGVTTGSPLPPLMRNSHSGDYNDASWHATWRYEVFSKLQQCCRNPRTQSASQISRIS